MALAPERELLDEPGVAAEAAISSDSQAAGPSKCFATSMLILNNLPILLALFLQVLPPEISASAIAIVSIIALVADYVKCRWRWAAGKVAHWPKLIAVTFLAVNTVILILVVLDVLTADAYKAWSGVITTGTLCVMSLFSELSGRSWIFSEVIDMMDRNPERLAWIQTPNGKRVFDRMISAITWVWTVTFLLMTLGQLVAAVLSLRHQKTASTVVGAGLGVFFGVVAGRCVTPRVVARVKEVEEARLTAEHSEH
eukprot:TRINITY_DN19860_c0_g3_i1.p1 TRINITY_DN19860_c0_g3~~TRINITY_DN19860_c0_g3_i1.p1  ORF type:complete len:254 (-),score=41.15 TRINITY_DN19860_c0_g3_i1:59-820(-)